MQKIQGWVEQGNTKVTTGGLLSTTLIQKSFPLATINVYLTGTVTLATIYSDNNLTPLANPFTANANGTWAFYAPNGGYDVTFSGAGISPAFTLNSLSVYDESVVWLDVTAAPFLADPTNTNDASSAINAAITAAAATGGIVYIPTGQYKVSGNINPKSNVTVIGQGKAAAQLNYTEASGFPCFYYASATRLSNVEFRDFSVFGLWDTTPEDAGNGARAFNVQNVDGLRFDNIGVYAIRNMGITSVSSTDVLVTGCDVQRTARDGVNLEDCVSIRVTDNNFKNGGDDCIACHTSGTPANPIRSASVASGNTVEDYFGIKMLGAAVTTIINNTFRRCKGYAIWMGSFVSTEGKNSSHGVTITGNTIEDNLNSTIIGLGNQNDCIYVGSLIQAGTALSGIIPGRNNTGSTSMTKPWGYFFNKYVDSTTTIAGGWGWNISHNNVVRTLQSGVTYSTWGFGEAFQSGGFMNPTLTEANFYAVGIHVVGSLRQAKIADNNLMAGEYGIFFTINGNPDWSIENVHIKNNDIFWALSSGISTDLVSGMKMSLIITDNFFDCDPYMECSNRGSNNTWQNTGAFPAGLDLPFINGAVIGRNHYRNVFQAIHSDGTTFNQFIAPEVQHCLPAAVGYNSGNTSIGSVGYGQEVYQCVLETGDLSSSSYETIASLTYPVLDAMPNSGTYVQGQFVRNRNPVATIVNTVTGGGGSYVFGWIRLTTGSSHVLGTDWEAVWVSTVSFRTWNAGTTTLLSGSTTVTVNHGLSTTPNAGAINVHPNSSLGSAATWWITSVGATSFVINVNTNPGQNVGFDWSAWLG